MLTAMSAFDMVDIPPRKKPRAPAAKSTSIYVTLSLWARLNKIAADLGRSRSELVTGILEKWADDYEAEQKKPSLKRQ
jgi:macrodomain Ter protein organizer (MatP/YcbG family)